MKESKSMSEVCHVCGLPKDLCMCETIAKEEQKIKVHETKKKFGKIITIIEGISNKNIDLKKVTKTLKSKFACGGTVKRGTIELQGSHKNKIKDELGKLGFAKETIEIK